MKVGDAVEALDDDISGHIIGIQGSTIRIVTSEDFEMEFHRSELVIKAVQSYSSSSAEHEFTEKIKSDLNTRPKKKITARKRKEQPPMEVDLHIGKLVNSTKGMSNFDLLNIQLETAKRQLEFAIRKRIQRVVFIHGVGEGVLRTELETLLKRYENLKYYDADYRKYGVGATEVYIFQNPKA